MEYTIKQAAEKTGLTTHTIRYYDKEGLLPLVKRTKSGIRKFSENDISWIELICCLKNSGMRIEEIKEFMLLCIQGAETCEDRREILQIHKEKVVEQIKQLQCSLEIINYKLNHYKEIGIFHIDK